MTDLGQVELVDGDQARALQQLGGERAHLRLHQLEVTPRVRRRSVDHVDESARALHVAQEALAESRPLGRALDEAWDVGDHHPAEAGFGDTQLWVEGCERVRRDFGLGRGHGAQQRGLACIGRPDQPDVGDELEVERDLQLLALQAGLEVVGSASCRALEVDVAAGPDPTLCNHRRRRDSVEIGDQSAITIQRDGADWDLEPDVGAVAPGLAAARAVGSVGRLPLLASLVEAGAADICGRPEDHPPAAPPIPAARPAARYEWFAPEGSRAASTMTAPHGDAGGIYEPALRPRRSVCLARDRRGVVSARGVVRLDGGATAIRADALVHHVAVDHREEGVIATDAHAGAGLDTSAALANDDRARVDDLAAVDLDAQLLRVRVAAVA